ncbi:NAD(+) diphosphatase, partial [Vibrio sp. 10N.286.49.E1]
MMGFLADYAGGTLKPDYSELSDAQWFDVTRLPEVAPVGTIARQLIETTVDDVMKDSVTEQAIEY